jgi:DNA processing protein
MERARRSHDDLRGALVREVARRTKARSHHPLPDGDTVALTRRKVEPMVRGLFPRAEHDTVLATLETSYTVVSGLAAGIDTAAHTGALDAGGRTIAVLGTPLGKTYPASNAALQERIAREFLVISQVPVVRYSKQTPIQNRLFFPERNVTMSALTKATVIIEAGNTSGTLIQARAALHQKRKLFILESCFRDPTLTWPERLQKQGAVRVRDYAEIRAALAS